jgi:hypothetical protein
MNGERYHGASLPFEPSTSAPSRGDHELRCLIAQSNWQNEAKIVNVVNGFFVSTVSRVSDNGEGVGTRPTGLVTVLIPLTNPVISVFMPGLQFASPVLNPRRT